MQCQVRLETSHSLYSNNAHILSMTRILQQNKNKRCEFYLNFLHIHSGRFYTPIFCLLNNWSPCKLSYCQWSQNVTNINHVWFSKSSPTLIPNSWKCWYKWSELTPVFSWWENSGGKCGVWVVGVNQNIIHIFWDFSCSDWFKNVELTIQYLSSRSPPGSCRTPPDRRDWGTPRRGRRPQGSYRWESAGRTQSLILSVKIRYFKLSSPTVDLLHTRSCTCPSCPGRPRCCRRGCRCGRPGTIFPSEVFVGNIKCVLWKFLASRGPVIGSKIPILKFSLVKSHR